MCCGLGSDGATRSDYLIAGEELSFSTREVPWRIDIEEPGVRRNSSEMSDLTGLNEKFQRHRGERSNESDGGGLECGERFVVV